MRNTALRVGKMVGMTILRILDRFMIIGTYILCFCVVALIAIAAIAAIANETGKLPVLIEWGLVR